MDRRPGRAALLVALGAVLVVAISLLGAELTWTGANQRRAPGGPAPMAGQLVARLGLVNLAWLAAAVTTPLLFAVGRRFPLVRDRWRAFLSMHLLVVLVLSTFVLLGFVLAMPSPPGGRVEFLRLAASSSFVSVGMPFVVILAAAHALEENRQRQATALAAARLHARLAESRLEAVTARLQPHFLFNALQGVSTLLHRDPVAADRLLTALADLLRECLASGARATTSLRHELGVVERFVEICRARGRGPLTLDLHVEPGLERAEVPTFLLQPLVENAVKHGVGPGAAGGRIEVRASRRGDALCLEVRDARTGGGDRREPSTSPWREGTGLRATRERLCSLHGERAHLEVRPARDAAGSAVTLVLPLLIGQEIDA